MIKIDKSKCVGCGLCVQSCPLGMITLETRTAVASANCVCCGSCLRECKAGAISCG
jgi:electron transfer flavoprotein alpha subunit